MKFSSLWSLLRDSGLVLVGRYGQYVVALISIPIVARSLGVEGFGQYAVATAGGFFGSLAVDLGLSSVLASDYARGEVRGRSRTTYIALRFAVLLFLVALLVAALLLNLSYTSLVLAGAVMGGMSSVGEDWLLIGSSRYVFLAISQLAVRLASLAGLVFVLPAHPSVWIAVWILAVANLVGAVLTWTVTWRLVPFWPPTLEEVGVLLRIAVPVVASRALGVASNQGPTLGFSAFIGPQVFGLFAASDKLVRAAQSSMDALSIALIPRLGRAAGRSGDAFASRVRRSVLLAMALGAAGAATLTLLAPWGVPFLLGSEFTGAVQALQIQVWSLPAAGVTSVCLGAVLITAKDYRGMLIVSLAGLGALPVGLAVGAMFSDTPVALAVGALIVDWTLSCAALLRTWVRHGGSALEKS